MTGGHSTAQAGPSEQMRPQAASRRAACGAAGRTRHRRAARCAKGRQGGGRREGAARRAAAGVRATGGAVRPSREPGRPRLDLVCAQFPGAVILCW